MLLVPQRGLGDDSTSNGVDASFLGGAVLASLVAGIGVIVAAKTVLSPARSSNSGRKWVEGAWRRADYEEWPKGSERLFRERRKRR